MFEISMYMTTMQRRCVRSSAVKALAFSISRALRSSLAATISNKVAEDDACGLLGDSGTAWLSGVCIGAS